MTLDDLNQAEYTSGHVCFSNDLDEVEGYDLSSVDESAFEDGEHVGYLSHPSEFFIRKNNFFEKAKNYNFLSACAKGLTLASEEILLLEEINNNAIQFLDENVILRIVPVEYSFEAISGFPNGYFSQDLSPFENYGLAKYLFEEYGYKLLGIGASLIGFFKNKELIGRDKLRLVEDLAKLYNCSILELKGITNQYGDILFLKYVDYLE